MMQRNYLLEPQELFLLIAAQMRRWPTSVPHRDRKVDIFLTLDFEKMRLLCCARVTDKINRAKKTLIERANFLWVDATMQRVSPLWPLFFPFPSLPPSSSPLQRFVS